MLLSEKGKTDLYVWMVASLQRKAFVWMYECVSVCVFVHVCLWYVCMYMYLCVYMCISVCLSMCMYIRMCIYVYCVLVCVCMRMHLHRHNRLQDPQEKGVMGGDKLLLGSHSFVSCLKLYLQDKS